VKATMEIAISMPVVAFPTICSNMPLPSRSMGGIEGLLPRRSSRRHRPKGPEVRT
jgi:hypothetical protein